jgi:hypothetical protein
MAATPGWLRRWFGYERGREYSEVTTEDEHLVGKESDEGERRYRDLSRAHRRLRIWLGSVVALLVLASIGLLLALSNAAFHVRDQKDATSPVPRMPMTRVTFNRNDTFAGPSSPERDQAWSAISPPGDGFVVFDDATRDAYRLPLGKHARYGDVYDISLFHQLHCLASIRGHMFTLEAAMRRENREEIYNILLKPKEDHVFHCFDYIRQALMCAGDMTIEWPRTEPDGRRFAVDGWGITHDCKSEIPVF